MRGNEGEHIGKFQWEQTGRRRDGRDGCGRSLEGSLLRVRGHRIEMAEG